MERKQGADAEIDFSSVMVFFCLFNASRKRKGIGKARRVITMSDDVVSVIPGPVSGALLACLWCARDNLISGFGRGVIASLNHVCQRGRGTD